MRSAAGSNFQTVAQRMASALADERSSQCASSTGEKNRRLLPPFPRSPRGVARPTREDIRGAAGRGQVQTAHLPAHHACWGGQLGPQGLSDGKAGVWCSPAKRELPLSDSHSVRPEHCQTERCAPVQDAAASSGRLADSSFATDDERFRRDLGAPRRSDRAAPAHRWRPSSEAGRASDLVLLNWVRLPSIDASCGSRSAAAPPARPWDQD